MFSTSDSELRHCIQRMGAIRWGTQGTCPPIFSDGGDTVCHVSPIFLSLGFVFRDVSKIKVTFVTFCVKSFSC